MRMLYQSRVGTRVANQRLNHVFIEGTSMHFTIERNRAIACAIYEELVYGLKGSDILLKQSQY